MVHIHPLTSQLNRLSRTNLIFAGKIHFPIPQRRKTNETERVEELFLEQYFTSDV